MSIYEHDTDTTVYEAAFNYPVLSGMDVTIAGVPQTKDITIPLLLTTATGPNRKPTALTVMTLPGLDQDSGSTFGGSLVAEGSNVFPRATYEGSIDTPFVVTADNLALPDVIVNGIRYHYASLIIAYLEGRAATNTSLSSTGVPVSSGWKRTDPNWFRDPFGRQYDSPKITDFTAQFVEGAPRRTNITMELMF